MSLCIGTNWDLNLLEDIKNLNNEKISKYKVVEVYGSMPFGPAATLREPCRLLEVDISSLTKYITAATKNKITTNYVLNTTVLPLTNINEFYSEIIDFIEKIKSAGRISVTISSPALLKYIRHHFPDLDICVSTSAEVCTIKEALYFQKLGVSKICLSINMNRRFNYLKEICKYIDCPIELIANECCLLYCPMRKEHFNLQSMCGIQKIDKINLPKIDELKNYPYQDCFEQLFNSKSFPLELLMAPWIRPEDIEKYKECGVSYFKITGRTMPSSWIINTIKEYAKGSHEHNLISLFPIVWENLDYEGKPTKNIFIDNKKLNDFIEQIIKNSPNCGYDCGLYCNICYKFAKEIISGG